MPLVIHLIAYSFEICDAQESDQIRAYRASHVTTQIENWRLNTVPQSFIQ
jgi:hypothetical protein